jgi:hypothetical protein
MNSDTDAQWLVRYLEVTVRLLAGLERLVHRLVRIIAGLRPSKIGVKK